MEQSVSLSKRARIVAGRWRFESMRWVANTTMPLLRRAARISEPIAEGHLFVLAHPRSGSTLLAHLLNEHPEIVGFGEHHVSYEDPGALADLEARTAFYARQPRLRTRFVMDKIVIDQHAVAPSVLQSKQARFIFLLREPAATLESYSRMFTELSTDADRFRKYRRRLGTLVEQARVIDDPTRSFVLTYEQLVTRSDDSLAALTTWLGLESPLQPDYQLTPMTGRQSWGDPSDEIKAGRILDKTEAAAIADADVADAADRLYGSSVRTLTTLCTTVPETGVDPISEKQPAPTPGERPPVVVPPAPQPLD